MPTPEQCTRVPKSGSDSDFPQSPPGTLIYTYIAIISLQAPDIEVCTYPVLTHVHQESYYINRPYRPDIQKRTMPSLSDAHQLLQLADVTRDSIQRIIAEWAKLPESSANSQMSVDESEASLPSRELFEAQRTLIGATGKLVELVSSPASRLLEVSSQYNEARCLHIAAVLRIPDILAESGDKGVSMKHIAEKVGIETRKLGMF